MTRHAIDALFRKTLAAVDGVQRVPLEALEPRAGFLHVERVTFPKGEIEALMLGRFPHLQAGLRIPSEQPLVGAEEYAIGSSDGPPDILEPAVGRRHAIDKRDIMRRPRFIRREVSELPARAHVYRAIRIHIERPDRRIVGHAHGVPAHAVIHQHAIVVADVDHAVLVLSDRPILRLRAVFARGIIAQEGQAHLTLVRPHGAFGAHNEWQDCEQE